MLRLTQARGFAVYLPSIETHPWICTYQLKRNGLFACKPGEKTSLVLGGDYLIEYDPARRIISIRDPLEELDEEIIRVISVK